MLRLNNWLALPVGNEGPSTFTLEKLGMKLPSFPTGQLDNTKKYNTNMI